MKPEMLEYASPPAPNGYARCVFPVLAFAAASFACGLASDYACGSFAQQTLNERNATQWIHGMAIPTVLLLRVILLVYTGLVMGLKAVGLASDRRYAIAGAWRVAVVGGAASGALTTLFRVLRSDAGVLTLLLATLLIPALFPFAFLRRRSR